MLAGNFLIHVLSIAPCMPMRCLRIYVYVMHIILRLCVLRRLRTRNLGQSDRYVPPGQSGRLSIRQASSAKTYLKHIRVARRNTVHARFGQLMPSCHFDLRGSRRGWTVGWAIKSTIAYGYTYYNIHIQ